MTMVIVPAVNGGEVCLNPDTAVWILPAAVGETCQVLMAGGTVYDIAMDVRGMKEVFADSFIQLMLAEPMPSKPGFVLVNPHTASSIQANDAQTSYVISDGERQLVVGSVTDVASAFNDPKTA